MDAHPSSFHLLWLTLTQVSYIKIHWELSHRPFAHILCEDQRVGGSLAEELGLKHLKVDWTLGSTSKLIYSHVAHVPLKFLC